MGFVSRILIGRSFSIGENTLAVAGHPLARRRILIVRDGLVVSDRLEGDFHLHHQHRLLHLIRIVFAVGPAGDGTVVVDVCGGDLPRTAGEAAGAQVEPLGVAVVVTGSV